MDILDCIIGIMYIVALGCTIYCVNKPQINKLKKGSKSINKVHFYVARDKNGELWLYIGKPIRGTNMFSSPLSNLFILPCNIFNHLGLNKKDYDSLKWEDEPIEVFLNFED